MLATLMLATLSAFNAKPGGEGFEIYVNNSLVLQQFGTGMNNVKSLSLADYGAKDEIMIKYHHCGKTGKNRVVTIKNGNDKVLKTLRFTDVNSPVSGMKFKLAEILSLKKDNEGTLKLFYASTELPGGRMLATIPSGGNGITRK